METSKFDLPYVRDFLMDYNVVVDVAETCLRWKDMRSTYRLVAERARQLLTEGAAGHGWAATSATATVAGPRSTSPSHSVAARTQTGMIDRAAELAHYRRVKTVLLDSFAECGATLSHHHAVGREHLPWLRAETAIGNVMPVAALKAAIDPDAIMNPGKLVLDEVE